MNIDGQAGKEREISGENTKEKRLGCVQLQSNTPFLIRERKRSFTFFHRNA